MYTIPSLLRERSIICLKIVNTRSKYLNVGGKFLFWTKITKIDNICQCLSARQPRFSNIFFMSQHPHKSRYNTCAAFYLKYHKRLKILMHWSLKNPIGNYCISKFALVQPIFHNLSNAKKKFNSVDQAKTPTSIDLIESNYQFQTVVVCYPLKILTFNYDNFARRKWKQWWIKVFIQTPGLLGQTLNLNLVWYVLTHAQNYSWISHLKSASIDGMLYNYFPRFPFMAFMDQVLNL